MRRDGRRQRWDLLVEATRTELWPLPTVGVLVAVLLGVALPQFDAPITANAPWLVSRVLFGGGPDAAREVLSAVAASLITVTSLTFSLTVVTLQLASTQYSPRVLRTFSRDRAVHATLALLLATFVYALTVLRTVRTQTGTDPAFVPRVSVTVALALTLGSVLALVLFLAHLARQIRVESIVRGVHETTAATMRRVLGDDATGSDVSRATGWPDPPSADPVHLVETRSSGFLTSVEERTLLTAAREVGAVIVIDREPGASLIAGTPIGRAWALGGGRLGEDERKRVTETVARCVHTGFERSAAQDVAFGLRQLVDVIARALSPGINDPTTAVHSLSHAAALLGDAAGRNLGPRLLRDEGGRVRVALARPDLATLLDLVVAQPLRYGASQPEVLTRLLVLLAELAWLTREETHHQTIQSQLARITSVAENQPFGTAEQLGLQKLARGVEEALAGRWDHRATRS
jgi:uncharacterized membrane protein